MRLQKFLSRAGVASRRGAEELMRGGRVAVSGVTTTEPGITVDPAADRITVDGREVRLPAARFIVLHKPAGYLTTRRDPGRRRTIYDLLPDELRSLPYVGRLDQGTEGLLLLTNDGDLAHRLTHPSTGIEREYRALVAGEAAAETFARLVQGVELEDGTARALRARALGRVRRGTWISLVLQEGRKREVRRMLEALGHTVHRLIRVRYGPMRLGRLAPGAWRELSPREVQAIQRAIRSRSPGS
ncbi:MAG: rRNA pseudouridine synthase [Gemmatimonadetes bacterium]|nr:rRNA pseudouridine synthase [Gemmatimonadota bacterium]